MNADNLPDIINSPVNERIDETAFKALFHENFAPLCAWCQIKFGISAEASGDAVQSAFMKFWESRNNLLHPAAARAYLFKITGNICLDLIRHQKVKVQLDKHIQQLGEPAFLTNGYETIDFNELNNSIKEAVARLPEQMRKVFILCKIEGLKYPEVAERCGISVKTVETQMGRALKKLRADLSPFLVMILNLLIWLDQKNYF